MAANTEPMQFDLPEHSFYILGDRETLEKYIASVKVKALAGTATPQEVLDCLFIASNSIRSILHTADFYLKEAKEAPDTALRADIYKLAKKHKIIGRYS